MERAATHQLSERAVALTGCIAVHLLVLIAVLAARPASPGAVARMKGLTIVSLPAALPPAAPTPPRLPSRLPVPLQPSPPPETSAEPAMVASAAPGASCPTLDQVTVALQGDSAAVAAIGQSPPETRSIADAIVLWNAGWSTASDALDAPLAPARLALERALARVPKRCLDEEVIGPRLVPIPFMGHTTFLVIGSGVWRWRGLLTDSSVVPASASRDARLLSTQFPHR